jgi:hypothetical protein
VLARKIAGKDVGCPHEWPDDRFDIVWTLDRSDDTGAPWTFTQAPQRLFAYDRDEPI